MISAKEQAAIDEITAALGADRELPLLDDGRNSDRQSRSWLRAGSGARRG
jgi:hypothetical protein